MHLYRLGSVGSVEGVMVSSGVGRVLIQTCQFVDDFLLALYATNYSGSFHFWISLSLRPTRGQSNLTKSASRGAHSPVRGHPRGSKFVPLNSWGRVSY